MYPAWVIPLAVSTYGWFSVTGCVSSARVVMQAPVLSGGMWASTAIASFLPGTLHRMVPPVLALVALQWVGDIYADTEGHPPNC